jgi:hypothetical protein
MASDAENHEIQADSLEKLRARKREILQRNPGMSAEAAGLKAARELSLYVDRWEAAHHELGLRGIKSLPFKL